MTIFAFGGILAFALVFAGCFCLNKKFRTEVVGMAWKWRLIWLLPTLLRGRLVAA